MIPVITDKYILDVKKDVHPDLQLSKDSITLIKRYLRPLVCKYHKSTNKSLDKLNEITKNILPKDLLSHAQNEGTARYKGTELKSYIGNLIRPQRFKLSLDENTQYSNYVNGVMDYLTAEFIELSGNFAKEQQKRRIIPKFIKQIIEDDSALKEYVSFARKAPRKAMRKASRRVSRKAPRKAMRKATKKKITVIQLRALCKEKGIKGYSKMNKAELLKSCV